MGAAKSHVLYVGFHGGWPGALRTFKFHMKTTRRQSMKLLLTRSAAGRMVLHLECIRRGGRLEFHWRGVRRELRGLFLRQ
jgi:hypothetical protein